MIIIIYFSTGIIYFTKSAYTTAYNFVHINYEQSTFYYTETRTVLSISLLLLLDIYNIPIVMTNIISMKG